MFLKVKWSEVGYPYLTFCFSWQYPLQAVHPVCPWTFSLLPDAPTATPHTELMEIGIPHAFRCSPQKTWKKILLKYSGLVKIPQSQFQMKRRHSGLAFSLLKLPEERKTLSWVPGGVPKELRRFKRKNRTPNKGKVILTIKAAEKWIILSSPQGTVCCWQCTSGMNATPGSFNSKPYHKLCCGGKKKSYLTFFVPHFY